MKKVNEPNYSNYKSVNEFAKILGFKKSPNKTSRFWNTITLLNKKSILNIIHYQDKLLIQQSEVNRFLSEHSTYKETMENVNINPPTLRKIVKKNNLTSYVFGNSINQMYLSNQDIKRHIYNEEFINGYDLLNLLKLDNKTKQNYPASTLRSVIKNIQLDKSLSSLIGYKKLRAPLFFKNIRNPQQYVFDKDLVTTFVNKHISTKTFQNEFNMSRSNFLSMAERRNIHIYSFYNDHNYKFISKEDYKLLKQQKSLLGQGASPIYLKSGKYMSLKIKNEHYTKSEVKKLLCLTNDTIDRALGEYSLKPDEVAYSKSSVKKIYFYSKKKIDEVKVKQTKLKEFYTEKYYTAFQISNISDEKNYYHLIHQHPHKDEIEIIKCPYILRGVIKNSSSYLYNKNQVNNILLEYKKKQLLLTIEMDSPYEEFVYKTENILEVSFPSYLNETKDLWYQYVKLKLKSKSNNINTYINQLSKTSLILSTVLLKEIYNYPVNSLNQLFFNKESEIPQVTLIIIHDFYINIAKTLEDRLEEPQSLTQSLQNPYNIKKDRIVDVSRYSFQEYKELYNYAINIPLHKANAIQDVKNLIDGKAQYHHYDSYWVYILVHLNNNWRHSTIITEIPEVDLSNTRATSLKWIKDNNLDIEEANSIIFQIGRSIKKISKTGAESEFRIAEPLKIPFATAICICQLRATYITLENNLPKENSGPLLWLSKKRIIQPRYTVHKRFFLHFKPGFKFSNRKMNKTLTTLIWSVFKSLKVAQVSRSHFNEDSTMYYIKLSNEQVEYLVNQLFERDSFGFINQQLINKLFANGDEDRDKETQMMLTLRQKFGDNQKVEISTGLLNRISKQNEDVLKFVNDLSKEEIKELVSKSMSNTLYSKQKYYQCVFSKCKFNNQRDCLGCPYSIINVYALSNLMDLYLNRINYLIDNFESSNIGEKQKLANQFYLLWRQIQFAMEANSIC